jgi:hypothetical protein
MRASYASQPSSKTHQIINTLPGSTKSNKKINAHFSKGEML